MSDQRMRNPGPGQMERVTAKRAAMEETCRATTIVTSSHAKKRPALANLSNVSSSHSIVAAKATNAVTKVKEERAALRNADSQKRAVPAKDAPCSTPALLIQPDPEFCLGSANYNSPASVASLERRTLQSLHISSESVEQIFDDTTYEDIDSGIKDPQMCGMYATDIYQHLRTTELKRRPTSTFMETLQHDINSSMRGILVDWLVEVAEEYKLVPDTLYLTVSYIDRYLSHNFVNRQRLQLLGVSCMLVAAKYEEISAPQVEEFCYITDNTYCKEELLDMERQVLNHLGFELTSPTIKTFVRRFMRAAQVSSKGPSLQLEFLGNYLSELTLVEYNFLKYVPSMVAASAVFLARVTIDAQLHPWDKTLEHYTGYKANDIEECVREMHQLQTNTKQCTLPAVREKYKQHKFKCVANLSPPPQLCPKYFQHQ